MGSGGAKASVAAMWKKNFKDISRQVFNRLTPQWPVGRRKAVIVWLCVCTCGNLTTVTGDALRRGATKSCGCLHQEMASALGNTMYKKLLPLVTTHGQASNGTVTPEYRAYSQAKQRCTKSNINNYADYGGRGIQFLFNSFEEWYAELGEKPEPKHLYSVDRIDNDGNYEPGNVQWATKSEQGYNRRRKQHVSTAVVRGGEYGSIYQLTSQC